MYGVTAGCTGQVCVFDSVQGFFEQVLRWESFPSHTHQTGQSVPDRHGQCSLQYAAAVNVQ